MEDDDIDMLKGYYTLDRERNPIPATSLKEWGEFKKNPANKFVCNTKVPPSLETVGVSTVFLGSEHGEVDGKPLLWETIVFGGVFDQEIERYTSYKDAIAGHLRMLDKVRGRR